MLYYVFPPFGEDWRFTFQKIGFANPYLVSTFAQVPWTFFIVYPLRLFGENVGISINSALGLMIIGGLVVYRKGGLVALVLTLTSFPLLLMLDSSAVEWIPAMGFIFQGAWSIPFLMVKPQSGIMSGLDWFIRSKNKIFFVIPTVTIVVSSFLCWGNWIVPMIANASRISGQEWNASWFPFSIPLGIILFFLGYKIFPKERELLFCASTYCVVPYFAAHSLIILFALVSIRSKSMGIVGWISLWMFPLIGKISLIVWVIGMLFIIMHENYNTIWKQKENE